MSKFIMTVPVLALAAAATPAHAQEYDWTGFYIGANGALADIEPEWQGTNIYQAVDGAEGGFTVSQPSEPIAAKPSNTEIGGGGRLGFNWQAGNFVLGAEADAMLFDFNGVAADTTGPATWTVRSHASNLETIRARAGVVVGSALLFATGGVAFSNLDHTLTATNVSEVVVDGGEGGTTVGTTTANLASTVDSGTGWTAGGGGELRLSEALSIALTVLYVDFGSEDLADSAALSSIAATVDTTAVIGALGLNLRF